ncbi:MAG TPA: hypothetical protein VKT25_12630, partial [Ktedonobacteraceae bacterium]|nr:hypothetical protein [Ktedonobacteraceae bacterium]
MSDQEMHFAEPDWQPSSSYAPSQATRDNVQKPPRSNDIPSTQAQEGQEEAAYAPYEEGYRIHDQDDHDQDEEPFRGFQGREWADHQQQFGRKKRGAWFWALLIILLGLIISLPFDFEDLLAFIPGIIIAGIVVLFALLLVRLFRAKASIAITETHTFEVAMQPKVIIRNDFGAIRVHAGDGQEGQEGQQVIISTIKQGRGLLGNPANASIHYEQNKEKNRISVRARTDWYMLARQQIDFDVTVPRLSDLEIKTDAGFITITGVHGQVNCASDAGVVRVKDAMLRGDSRLKTDAGTVTFDGSLDPQGSYSMTTDAGNVSVTLPAQSSFKLDART